MPETYGLESAHKSETIGDSSHAILGRFLDINGDGTGAKNMNVDGSAVTVPFFIKPPVSQNYIIKEIVLKLQASGPLAPDTFGNLAALANGCLFKITEKPGASDATLKLNLLDGLAIKTNTDMALIGHVDRWSDVLASSIIVHQTLRKASSPIALFGERGNALEFVIQDDLTTLIGLYIQVLGRITLK